MKLEGIFIAATTPFLNDHIEYQWLRFNIRRWMQSDITGFVVLGSTSEFVFLNREEKIRVVATALEEIGKEKQLIAGIGCESVAETVKLGRVAAELGVAYGIAVNPYYYKPLLKEEVLYTYYISVAEELPIPLLIYNIPRFTGIHLSVELISRLAQHENIIGIKDSSGVLPQYLGLTEIKDFRVFTGDFNSFLQTTFMGVHGGIFAFANAVPQEICDVYRLAKANQANRAAPLHKGLLRLANRSIGKYGLPGLKRLMEIIGYRAGSPRLPFTPLDNRAGQDVAEAYREFQHRWVSLKE